MSKVRRHVVKRKGDACSGLCIREDPVLPGEMCKELLASTICINAFFYGGDVVALIPHLRDAHGMSFEQIKIGIDEIRNGSKDPECFKGWENCYVNDQQKPI